MKRLFNNWTVQQLRPRCRLRKVQCSLLLLCCPLALVWPLLLLQKNSCPSVSCRDSSWAVKEKEGLASSQTGPQGLSGLAIGQSLPEAQMLARIRNGSVRCSDIQSMFPGRIPPVVHWTNRDARVLLLHQEMLLSWLNILGDSVAYMYWQDKDVEQLIRRHYPRLWQHYRNFTNGLLRSDIGRLAILHHVGGVYTDLDVQLLRSLHPLMHNYTALWSQEPKEHIYFTYGRRRLLSNAIFLSRARHQFLGFVLHSWPDWFQATWSHRSHVLLADVSKAVDATGPLMLNEMLDKYPNSTNGTVSLAHPDLFQPTWDLVYAPGHARRRCAFVSALLTQDQRSLCQLLRRTQFRGRAVPREAFAVHKFLHTSYGGNNSFVNATLAGSILPLSRCLI